MNLLNLELTMLAAGIVAGICISLVGMLIVQWKLSGMTLKEFFQGAE
ncbi:hypothetical protein [Oenococcus oeni]|nr:hypothetical protein [Oenococcus oeni]SYW13694.1 conserved hypothetical protein [Oenococcus oeni]